MSKLGNIIFLNGLTSASKSSILKELSTRKPLMFYTLGFDLFEETMPPWCADEDRAYAKAILAMYEAVKGFSKQGEDVFIDGLIMNIQGLEHHYDTLLRVFEGYPLKIVQVYCPLEILRERNLRRGDRREDQSYKQSLIAETAVEYWLRLDTSLHSIPECADLLTDALRSLT